MLSSSRAVTYSAAAERLQKLVAARAQKGADRDAIDQRIWELFGEDWAVMFTDLSGFSRGVEKFGITHFLQIIYESLRIFSGQIEEHGGVLLKVEGDSMMVLFREAKSALACAIAMQRAAREYNRDRPPEEQILLCVGLGHGRMLRIGEMDVYGAEVNGASKLGEDVAEAWEILVTEGFKKAVGETALAKLKKLKEAPAGVNGAHKAVWE
ncbi:MAG: adenylate/guanylate cyclase domain-containing protein [Planctomycetes bacterium]|nr:adenylate/guanylate cyclase domain-containing protein [Planctomycetota bacterium]